MGSRPRRRLRVAAIAAVVSVAVASCGGRTTAPPSAASNKPVPEAGTGSVPEAVPLALAGATNDAGDASNTTGDSEADRDRDGIPDREDRCPDSLGPLPDGCPRHGGGPDYTVSCGPAFPVISFWDTSTQLPPESNAAIREVADLMKATPCMNVAVIGHVSGMQFDPDPEKTGTARAAGVLAALVRAGVDRKRLVAKYGGSLPGGFREGSGQVWFEMMNRGDACNVICPPQ